MRQSTNPIVSLFRKVKLGFTFSAVVDLLLGLILVFMPNTSQRVLCMLVGAGMLVYGIFNILSFIAEGGAGAYSLELLTGICAAAFGIFSLVNPAFLTSFLFTVLGLVILVASICSIRRALSLHAFGFTRWWLSMLFGCVALLIALSIIFSPGLYGNMLMMVIGVVLIVEAISDLLSIHRLSIYTR